MADYVSVLEQAIDGLDTNDSEARAELYDKARAALRRQLDALGAAMPPDQIAAQMTGLEEAVASVEATFSPPSPDDILDAGFQSALGALAADPVRPAMADETDMPDDSVADRPDAETAGGDQPLAPEEAKDPRQAVRIVEGGSRPDDQPDEAGSVTLPSAQPGNDADPNVDEPGLVDEPELQNDDPVDTTDATTDGPGLEGDDNPVNAYETGSDDPDQEREDDQVSTAGSTADDSGLEGDNTPVNAIEPTADDPDDQMDELAKPAEDVALPVAEEEDDPDTRSAAEHEDGEPALFDDDLDEDDYAEDHPFDEGECSEPADVTADADRNPEDNGALGEDDSVGEDADEGEKGEQTLAFATRARLDEVFGSIDSQFNKPRSSSLTGDPLDRARSAVESLKPLDNDGRREPTVIPFAAPRPSRNATEPDTNDDPIKTAKPANDPDPVFEPLRVEPIEIPSDGENSKAWVIWLGVALIVAAGGALGYSNRDTVLPMLHQVTEKVRKIDESSPPAEIPKIEDRIPAANSSGNEPSGTATAESGVDQAPATQDTAQTADTTGAAPAEPRKITPGPETATPSGGTETQTTAAEAPAQPTTAPETPATEAAILYEEASGDGGSDLAHTGTITWTVSQETGPSGIEETVLQARTMVAPRDIAVTLAFRKNTDATLPASHTVEVFFNVPADNPFGMITNIGGVLMKPAEPDRGQALIGAVARVTDGFFIVGLSDTDQDRATNIQLLKVRTWFDIPVLFDNGKRGIVTLAKGDTGEKAFAEAFEAWGE